jgi:CzcA family heavy metal efflux pump
MMRWIIGSSVQLRLLIVAFAAFMMVIGITRLRDMPVDVYPEFTPPHVEIQTEALGLSAAEVEQLITVPLEQDLLNGVAWLQSIRSESIPGLSSVVLVFEPGTDIMRARQMVNERLTQSHGLPQVSKPPVMLQPLSSTSRVLKVGLSSEELSLIELSVLARWTMRPRLMGVPGVANVSIWGQRKRQLQVQVDPERLRASGVTLQQIIRTTGDALWLSPLTFLESSLPGTGGFIDTPNQRLGVRHVLPISSAEDLAKVTVSGEEMLLGDITNVVENHQPLIGDAIIGDDPGLLLVIEKFPWANTLEVTRGVEEALDDLRPGLSGIEIDSAIFRPATFIETTINNLSKTLLIGIVLVILVLGIFLYHRKSALFISLVVMILSLAVVGLVFHLRGITVNMMILGGLMIALCVFIDDAVIDMENIVRSLRRHRKEGSDKSTASIIIEASLEMRSTIAYATVILLLPVVPVFFLEDLSSSFFRPLALSYALAVLASLAVALTVTPALSMLLLRKARLERGESFLIRWVRAGYNAVLSRTVHKPRLILFCFGIIVLSGLALLPMFQQESLLPLFKESDFLISWEGAPGTSQPEMSRIATRVSRELRAIPGVRNVGAHVGRAVMSDEVVNVNASQLWVSIDPEADYEETVDKIQEVVHGYPGLYKDALTYPEERIREVQTGVAGEDIVVRLYGEDLEILLREAEKVSEVLMDIEGVVDTDIFDPVEEPAVEIEVDLAKAERYGIKPGDVRRASAALLSGIEVGMLFEEQKVFDVVVWATPETRQSLTSIRELLIDTPQGGHVRLEDVADVRVVSSPNVINREAVSRLIDISADVGDADIATVAAAVASRLHEMDFPLEYHAEILGQHAERQAARRRLLSFAIAAAIGIFLLLQASFGCWRLAFLMLVTLPMTVTGGVLAAYAVGGELSLGSLAGFITIFGISTRQAIVLIKQFHHLERHGETFGAELVLRGAREQLAPIMTTVVTTALAILPMVIIGNIPGHEILYPMAVVILGGLVTSTIYTLLIVPILYLRFGSDFQKVLDEEEAFTDFAPSSQ